jgi:beta-glucosidase
MNIEKIISELTLEEKAGLCSGRDFCHTKAVDRLDLPSVMMCDATHGLRKQEGEGDHLGIRKSIEAVCFPTGSALASSFDRNLLERLGEVLGDECQAEDIAMLLGPGINIKRSPLCGRNFEYLSEDPCLAGRLAAAYVKGLQGRGVAVCVKHFAANNQETFRASGSSQVDERTLHEIYLPAFETVVKEAKPRGVMCSYNQINGVFSAENKELLTGILRERWGFEGIVVSDWGTVKDRVKGLLAGLDLEMPGGPGSQDAKIVRAVKNGSLDEATLNKAVRNLLKFLDDYQRGRKPGGKFDIKRDHALSAEFAKECAVLLKNDGPLLPLSKTAKTAFIGEFAQKPRYQGAGSSHVNVPRVISPLEAVEGVGIVYAQGYRAAEEQPDQTLIDEAVQAALAADAAVIFAGLPDSFETEGVDRNTLSMPENQNRLIEAVAKAQPNTAVVFHGGAPVEMPWAGKVKAILAMYLGGDAVGAAATALLFGDANPSGKLAETFPRKLADNPSYLNFPGERGIVEYREGIYVGYRYYDKKEMPVLFPFGHGLSYTTFECRALKLDKTRMQDTETLTVSCEIQNTGQRFGKEAVQLYVRNPESVVNRPIRELRDFTKVELAPNEKKTISFTLDKRAFAYYEPKIHDWHVESGIFIVEIGVSSRDIRLSAEVEVQGTARIPVKFTGNSVLGDLKEHDEGRALLDSILRQSKENSSLQHLGEARARGVSQTIMEMPLSTLVTYGRLTEEELEQLLNRLNFSGA